MLPSHSVKPTEPLQTIPAVGPTLRVTESAMTGDGGSFLLSLGELRPVQPYGYGEMFADGNSAYVEHARFALSQTALVTLKNAIAEAEAWHTRHFGPLLDVVAHKAKITEEIGPTYQPQPELTRVGLRGV